MECTSKLLRGSISYSDVFHWFSSCPVTIVLVPERERDRDRQRQRQRETNKGKNKRERKGGKEGERVGGELEV